jgi:EAL domain-containing protein (putative c-di-GMP-specific phosphodiesterase class I)
MFPSHSDNAVGLLKAADVALYALKTSGRGGTRMFDPGMLADDERARSQLETARAAVEAETLVPHYQPKVDLISGEIVGFEALLRAVNGSRLDLPATMQEAFGDYELASRIGELMQNQVAAQAAKWLASGFEFGRISINASPAEFLRDDYAERLLDVLALHDVPAARIEVEVTEHVFMGQCGEYVVRALSSLRSSGIHVSLDDFGTGYSSLSHLRDLQVDTVKIDKSFIERITADKGVAAIVTAVISLARSLGLNVVAEGIEKPSQAELLGALGCQYGQGFLFGDALSKDAAEQLLAASQESCVSPKARIGRRSQKAEAGSWLLDVNGASIRDI